MSEPGFLRAVPPAQLVGFLAMVVGMFMAILDIQIVASSLAQIQAGISAGPDEIGWVQTSYLIAEVVMIPLSGWMARVVSTRLLFVASCLTFTLASAACAFAWSIGSMMVFRALQGFLGGAMIPTVFATSFRIFPRRHQASVSVLVGLVATMAPTLGPSLGGWLTGQFSWHWLFLINLVPGLVVALLVFLFVRIDRPDLGLLKGFDLPGIVLVALFLGTLQYVLEEGPGEDWLGSRMVAVLLLVSGTSGVLLVWRELTIVNPVVDLRAFADRNFLAGCVFSFVLGVGLYGSVYLLPLYMARVRGWDSLEIGVAMMVTGAFQFLSAPLAGALARHLDPRLMLGAGLALFGGGLWLNGSATAEWGFAELFLPQAVRGISLMLCFVPINGLALGLLPPEKLQNAAGLYNLMRNLGGAIGLAVINTQLASRFDLHQLRLSERLGAAVAETVDGLAGALEPALGTAAQAAAWSLLAGLARREAMVMTFNDLVRGISLVFVAALLLMPLVRRPKGTPGPGH